MARQNSAMAQEPLSKEATKIRELLQKAREVRGWSQSQAALALGLGTTAQYIKIEQRGSVPKWLLGKFNLVLGIPLERLILVKPTRSPKVVQFPVRATPKKRTDTKQ